MDLSVFNWYFKVLFQSVIVLAWIIIIWSIIKPFISGIIDRIQDYKLRKLVIESDKLIRDTKYKEEEIIGHLNYIINETIDEYVILNIMPKDIYYINKKIEDDMIKSVSKSVGERVSKTLIHQLSFIYNEDYVGSYIGSSVYMAIVDYVVKFNTSDQSISSTKSTKETKNNT
jgi:hypothetical protein